MADFSTAPRDRQLWRRIPGRLAFYGLVAGFLVIILLPLYYIFLTAFSPNIAVFSKPLNWFPQHLTLDRFRYLFEQLPLLRYFGNTLLLSVISTLLALGVCFLAAYGIAKLAPPGVNFVLIALMASTMLPGVSYTIPLFIMFRNLGLINTFTGLTLLYGSLMLPVTTWVLVSVIRAVPDEIEDAAKVDGANTLQVLFKIMLPLCRPGLATMFLINFVVAWNEFFIPLVFATGQQSKVVSLMILEAGGLPAAAATSGWLLDIGNVMAAGLLVTVPVFLIALVFQRQIVSGLISGAYK